MDSFCEFRDTQFVSSSWKNKRKQRSKEAAAEPIFNSVESEEERSVLQREILGVCECAEENTARKAWKFNCGPKRVCITAWRKSKSKCASARITREVEKNYCIGQLWYARRLNRRKAESSSLGVKSMIALIHCLLHWWNTQNTVWKSKKSEFKENKISLCVCSAAKIKALKKTKAREIKHIKFWVVRKKHDQPNNCSARCSNRGGASF